MPQTRECDFCGGDIEPGTGTMFVYADGRTVHFCSSKCENNAELGREPRDVEWTAEGQAQTEGVGGRGTDTAAGEQAGTGGATETAGESEELAGEQEFDTDDQPATTDRVEADTQPQDEVHEERATGEGEGRVDAEDEDDVESHEDVEEVEPENASENTAEEGTAAAAEDTEE